MWNTDWRQFAMEFVLQTIEKSKEKNRPTGEEPRGILITSYIFIYFAYYVCLKLNFINFQQVCRKIY